MSQTDSQAARTVPAPRWTIPSFRMTPGRYPLGIEAVNFNQLDDLASGLPVLSQHPRYWSIYTYIVKRFWDLGLRPQTNAALGRFLKAQEVVFASAALSCEEHAELPGILGRNSLAPYLRQAPAQLPLDLAYLDQSLGGYGQVYRGAMADLGLILRAELNPVAYLDAPMGELGANLAEAFAQRIAGTTYARQYADQAEGTIPIEVVKELGKASCFHRLSESDTERQILTSVLRGALQPPHQAHRNRAATVHLFLDLAQATQDRPVDEERFRRLLYWGTDEVGERWRASHGVESTWRRWWLLRHRELIVEALNALFTHLVLWGLRRGGTLRPQPIADYTSTLTSLFLTDDVGLGHRSLAETSLAEVVSVADRSVRADGWPPHATRESLQEDVFLGSARRGLAAETPVFAFVALVVALRRLAIFLEGTQSLASDWPILSDGGDERVGTNRLASWLNGRLSAGASAGDAIGDLVRVFVVRQHLRIARGKLPEDTFRFHDDGRSLRFVDQGDRNGVNPISIRFNSVASALAELGLINAPFGVPGHGPADWAEEGSG